MKDACMIFLNGKDRASFRCHCGCNVFQPLDLIGYYDCNACGERYFSEPTPENVDEPPQQRTWRLPVETSSD